MNSTVKKVLIAIGVLALVIISYKTLFMRTVNYEIGGINIPSKYNLLTGKVTPIIDYKGKDIKRTVHDRKADKLGLTGDEVSMAQFQWALFENWASSRPEYKGWEENPELFKKAHDDFQKMSEASGRKILVIK